MLKIMGFSEKEMINLKTNIFKFVQPLYKFRGKALGISVISDFTHDVLLKDIYIRQHFQCYALKSFLDDMNPKFFPSPHKWNEILEIHKKKKKKYNDNPESRAGYIFFL
jgi:DUF971 family protein